MDPVTSGVSQPRRERLADKGRRLYRKSCGTSGKKTCAEGFTVYHIRRGEVEIAQDLLVFLETEADVLRRDDPAGRLAWTEELITRIRRQLPARGDDPPGARSSASFPNQP